MDRQGRLAEFAVEGRRYALPLAQVDSIVRAVEVTPLPQAPAGVLGVVNVHGRVVPVIDVRAEFDLPSRDISPGDCFVIASNEEHTLAVWADKANGLVHDSADHASADNIYSGLRFVDHVIVDDEEIIVVLDLQQLAAPARGLDVSEPLEQKAS